MNEAVFIRNKQKTFITDAKIVRQVMVIDGHSFEIGSFEALKEYKGISCEGITKTK